VSISIEDVRHIAQLARLGISDERARTVAVELNGILAHMQALATADTSDASPADATDTRGAMPLRPDDGPAIPLARAPSDFAPEMREGLFLVPRLSTHEDADR
jgi:aspartyl-tRNA(Asn)/glutamyl-tRNA(Gln) amidotransferase subunit C